MLHDCSFQTAVIKWKTEICERRGGKKSDVQIMYKKHMLRVPANIKSN